MFACAASNRRNLTFITTIIEDTHLTLIGIPFEVEANNSLLFLPLQAYEKKFAEFPLMFLSIIPWLVKDDKYQRVKVIGPQEIQGTKEVSQTSGAPQDVVVEGLAREVTEEGVSPLLGWMQVAKLVR